MRRRTYLLILLATCLIIAALAWWALRGSSRPARGGRVPGVSGDAWPLIEKLIDPSTDLPTRLTRLKQVMSYATSEAPEAVLTSPAAVSNFLEYQVLAKCVRVDAEFRMLLGERSEALSLLAATYYLGELMTRQHGTSITSLIGDAIRAITLGSLETVVLNASETTASRQMLWDTLADLNARTIVPTRPLVRAKAGLLERLLAGSNIQDIFIRRLTIFVRLQLVRAAAAALERLALSGGFPRTPGEFAPRLPSGPGPDPFTGYSTALRFTSTAADVTIWSVGPDGSDDSAALTYDPTNGTVSGGDLVIHVPRDRKYPFPTSGTAVLSSAIPTLFPHGLPPDPFADARGTPYTQSAADPRVIYSFGPDTDQSARTTAAHEHPYDPTNGITSDGDIWATLPK